MVEKGLKDFYSYTDDELRNTLPKDTYCLKIREAEVSEWEDGRPRLDIQTEVQQQVGRRHMTILNIPKPHRLIC